MAYMIETQTYAHFKKVSHYFELVSQYFDLLTQTVEKVSLFSVSESKF